MSRRVWAVGMVVVCGCGPLERPLPVPLPADDQQKLQQAWDAALTPPDKIDRQTWLDVLAGGRLYQHGVDRLDLRSEKRWAGGMVVMEVRYDRAKPANDRFSLTVTDAAGNTVRSERYMRDEVDEAVATLSQTIPEPTPGEPAEMTAKRTALLARMKRIEAVLVPLGDKVTP